MKKVLLAGIVIIGWLSGCSENNDGPDTPPKESEVTLFDKATKPVVYIDYADTSAPTIYMWDGTPVAYFEGDEDIYHFNGAFLGWYREGVLYDKEGYAVAAEKGVVKGEIDMNRTYIESVKSVKHVKPVPHVQSLKPVVPVFKDEWSVTTTSLAKFFLTEITLFDKNKEAIAYIDYADDAPTIYLWDGTPVAYVESPEAIYRFNGKLLGWYIDDVLFDRAGEAVAAERDVVRGDIVMTAPQVEPVKSVKGMKPVVQKREQKPAPPHLKYNWSETSLTDFFLSE